MPDRDSISRLEDHVGYWLRMVSNHVSYSFRQKVEANGVTVAEWVVLRVLLDRGECAPSDIAQTLGMTRGAISKLVERLFLKRLVKCRVNKKDRRFQTLALTPAGSRLVPTLAKLADQNDAQFFKCLTREQRESLMELMKLIASAHRLTDAPMD